MASSVIQTDVEKSAAEATNTSLSDGRNEDAAPEATSLGSEKAPSRLRQLNARIEGLSGFEARGITRVLPDERQPPSLWDDIAVALLWFSANISVNNLAVGLFGPLLFGLGFFDSAMCAVFGGLLGSISTAYMSIWGPQSGNRTMVSFDPDSFLPRGKKESCPLRRRRRPPAQLGNLLICQNN